MTVTSPDVSVWWDAATVTAQALDLLRLTDTDADAGRVGAAVGPAGQHINQYLDRDPADAYDAATAPPQVQYAVALVVVNLYRDKDAPASLDGALLGVPVVSDPLAGVRPMLAPFRARRGIG